MRPSPIALGESTIMVLPFGRFEHPKHGTLIFDAPFAEALIKHFRTGVRKIVPFIDQDHDEGKAAAWFKNLVTRSDGIYATVEWTPLGESLLRDKLYRYFSPWFGPYLDEATGRKYAPVLFGGALTNVPFLKVMPEVMLSDPAWRTQGTVLQWADLMESTFTEQKEGGMKLTELGDYLRQQAEAKGVTVEALAEAAGIEPTTVRQIMDGDIERPPEERLRGFARVLGVPVETLLEKIPEALRREETATQAKEAQMDKKLKELLGLTAEATEQELEAAVVTLKETAAVGLALQEDGLKLGELKGLKARIVAAETQAKDATAHALTAVKKLADREITGALDAALREGKIVPKQKDWARAYAERDFEGFRKFIETAEPVITFMESGFDGEGPAVKLSALERQIAKQIGLSEEDLLRYGYGVTQKEDK